VPLIDVRKSTETPHGTVELIEADRDHIYRWGACISWGRCILSYVQDVTYREAQASFKQLVSEGGASVTHLARPGARQDAYAEDDFESLASRQAAYEADLDQLTEPQRETAAALYVDHRDMTLAAAIMVARQT
jgi:hypothetical protein